MRCFIIFVIFLDYRTGQVYLEVTMVKSAVAIESTNSEHDLGMEDVSMICVAT